MKLKKRIATLVLTLVVTLTAATGVSASQGFSYSSIKVEHGKQAYIAPATANQNYKYVLNYMTSKSGSAAVHSSYYTYFDGSMQNLMSSSIKTTEAGSAFWRPANVSGTPSGWNIVADPGGCPAVNSSGNYCALKGSSYALYLKNNHIAASFTITGQFTFTN